MKPGSVINGRYEIISELGRGGMGVVYRARHQMLGRDVAIKILNESLTGDGALRAQREGQALANIKHPNLVHVFALEQDESGRMMLVFDYVDGVPLSSILGDEAINLEDAASLFAQLCSGLQALHTAGFVHRDIKPSNLMITSTSDGAAPHLVIIDFGLVKSTTERSAVTSQGQKLTATGSVLGTPLYMSPEQFNQAAVSPQSDNYSAACVLYEMLTGKTPFGDESIYVIANSHMNEAPPTVPASLPNHHSLNSFFGKALAKTPEERHPSAQAMNDAFQNAIGGQTISGPRQTRTTKNEAFGKSNPGNKIWIVATIAAITAASIVAALILHGPPSSRALLDRDATEIRAISVVNIAKEMKTHDDPGAQAYVAKEIADLERNYPKGGTQMATLYQVYALLLILPADHLPPVDYNKSVEALEKAVALVNAYGSRKDKWSIYNSLFKTLDSACRWREAYEVMTEQCLPLKEWHIYDMVPLDQCGGTHAMERAGLFDELLQIYTGVHEPDIMTRHGIGAASVRRDIALAYIWKNQPKKALEILSRTIYYTDADSGDMQQRDTPVGLSAAALANDERAYAKYKSYEPPSPMLFMQWTYKVTPPAAAAIHEANAHHADAATKLIDSVLAQTPQPAPPTEVVHYPHQTLPERQREYIFALSLCKEAAKRLGDTDRQAQCTNRIKQINDELVKHNRIFPGIFS